MSSVGILANVQTAAAGAAGKTAGASGSGETAAQWFLNYMKESPAQRLEDSWLAAHGLTEKDLANMSPQQREAILKQMAEDLKQKMQQAVQQKTQASPAASG